MSNIQALAQLYPEYVIKYEDLHKGKNIGKGGSSDVFVGMQISTGKMCAIKVLHAESLDNEMFVLFSREVTILIKCQNRFLLKFVGFTAVYPFTIVTEYVSNGSLYDALHSEAVSSEIDGTKKTILALGIANGCKRLHKLGILHRDIKSLNVLLDADFMPHICDFGLSRFKNESFQSESSAPPMTTNVGTPHWMAPELFEDRPYDEKVDVYAYGMMLWEILTCLSPFRGKSSVQIMYAVTQNHERPKIPLMTPGPLKDLINACWHQEPSKRPDFKKIYHLWATGKVAFSGTDERTVQKIVSLIQNDRIEMKKMRKDKKLLPKVQNPNISPASTGLINFSLLSDPSNPNFLTNLSEISSKINEKNVNKFYEAIVPSLSSPDVLEVIRRLFETDDNYVKSFVNVPGILQKLPMSNNTLSEQICQILLHIFILSSEYITYPLLDAVAALSQQQPFKVLRLLNVVISKYIEILHKNDQQQKNSKAEQNGPDKAIREQEQKSKPNQNEELFRNNAIYAGNLVLKQAANYVSLGAGDPLLRQLYSLMVDLKGFKEEHLSELINVIAIAQTMGNAVSAALVYQIACLEPFLINSLDIRALSRHILVKETSQIALTVASKMKPNSLLVNSLIQASYENENAFLILCSFLSPQLLNTENSQEEAIDTSENEKIMNEVSKEASKWMEKGIPTITNSVKLCLLCLKNFEFRTKLPKMEQFPTLLKLILKYESNNIDLLKVIWILLQNLDIDAFFLKSLIDNEFLEQYYQTVTKLADSALLISVFALTEKLGRIGYSSGFMHIVPIIEAIILSKREGWINYAISLAATLSCYVPTKEEIKKRPDVINVIKELAEIPELSPHASVFLNNIKI